MSHTFTAQYSGLSLIILTKSKVEVFSRKSSANSTPCTEQQTALSWRGNVQQAKKSQILASEVGRDWNKEKKERKWILDLHSSGEQKHDSDVCLLYVKVVKCLLVSSSVP